MDVLNILVSNSYLGKVTTASGALTAEAIRALEHLAEVGNQAAVEALNQIVGYVATALTAVL